MMKVMNDESKVNINWFPGHMAKTERKIRESLKLCDIVLELIDSRIPVSSRNPKIDKIINQKRRIIILNKSDMADMNETSNWINKYKSNGINAIAIDSKKGKGTNKLINEIKKVMSDKIEKWNAIGMKGRKIRVMIVGIPNVGKSSLINKLIGKNKAKCENRPGVTRVQQWFNVDKDLELLDTPGVLWPKFDEETGRNLAITGAIKDSIINTEDLSFELATFLRDNYLDLLCDRFKLEKEKINDLKGHELVELIGKKRGMLLPGGIVNIEQATTMLLDEFRSCKIGNITLEKVN